MENVPEIELRVKVLLSTYSAMLGMISPDIRFISINWSNRHYAIKAVYDRPINDDDLDILKSIATEVIADFPLMIDVNEYAEYSLDPIEKIKGLKEVVFLRFGELEH